MMMLARKLERERNEARRIAERQQRTLRHFQQTGRNPLIEPLPWMLQNAHILPLAAQAKDHE